ncbi:MAG: OmpA family protein [candidate division Zixibacteria bacterium]|nr:OmpA family protein [candidate division Zixibacteria bacterium]
MKYHTHIIDGLKERLLLAFALALLTVLILVSAGHAKDSDNDGMPDNVDKRPHTAGYFNPYVTASGNTPHFVYATNSFELNAGSRPILDRLVRKLKASPDTKVEIRGYADDTGNDAHNLKLSHARAHKVKTYLVSRGVHESRVLATGYGENPSHVVGDNSTSEGRQKNRRVEVKLVN